MDGLLPGSSWRLLLGGISALMAWVSGVGQEGVCVARGRLDRMGSTN